MVANFAHILPGRARIALLAVFGLALAVLPTSPVVADEIPDLGFAAGSSYGTGRNVTGEKPESKTWQHAGSWWAVMRNIEANRYEIHRFDAGAGQWGSTGVLVNWRGDTRSDVLSDGDTLYVSTHFLSASNTTGSSGPSELVSFRYDPATDSYHRRAGFPVTISNDPAEALTIAKDSAGQVWATWTRNRAVYVASSLGSDTTWTEPFELPLSAATGLDPDDISTVTWTGDRLLVMWSDQAGADPAVYAAEHLDGAAPDAWTVQPVVSGAGWVDDHLDLATVPETRPGGGAVAAVLKTEFTGAGEPGIVLAVRDAATGGWDTAVVAQAQHCLTRPMVVADVSSQQWQVFASGPGHDGCNYFGEPGVIYQQSTPMSDPAFLAGRGTPVMRAAAYPDLNNVTAPKAPVTSAPVLLASSDAGEQYWSVDLRVLPDDPEPTEPPSEPEPTDPPSKGKKGCAHDPDCKPGNKG